jgi:hypothetical protein
LFINHHAEESYGDNAFYFNKNDSQNVRGIQRAPETLKPQYSQSYLEQYHPTDTSRWAPYQDERHSMRSAHNGGMTENRPPIVATGTTQYPYEGEMGKHQQYMHAVFAQQQQRGPRDFAPRPAGYGQGQSQLHYPSGQPIFAATGQKGQIDFSQPTASTLGAVPENPDTIVQREAKGMMRAPPKHRKPNKLIKSAHEVYSSQKRRLVNYTMKLNSFLNRRCFITEPKCTSLFFDMCSG